jgi:hypothetical protein
MKQFTSPFTLRAADVSAAWLETTDYSGVPQTVQLSVVNDDATHTATLSTKEAIADGVWRLRVTASCGCFSQLVQVKQCPTPVLDSVYDKGTTTGPAPGMISPEPSCDPAT